MASFGGIRKFFEKFKRAKTNNSVKPVNSAEPVPKWVKATSGFSKKTLDDLQELNDRKKSGSGK